MDNDTPLKDSPNIGKIEPISLTDEMQKSYLDYAMSVIVSRALPDVRDGLKPVQRRIVYAMQQQNLHHTSKYQKSAAVVGEVMKNFHPHGDSSIYDAMVRMAQDFSMRYMLVDGQGNFGSVDGDSPAAMRYCLTGNSLIATSNGLQRIEDLSPNQLEDFKTSVLSLNRVVNTTSKWFDSGEHPTIKITTKLGYELQGSRNHPVLTWIKNPLTGRPGYKWKLISEMISGDIVVLDRTADLLWIKRPINLNKFAPIGLNFRTQVKKLPQNLTSDLAFILGALISEGSISKDKLEFCNSDVEFISYFEKAWKNVFPDCRLHRFGKNPSSYGKKPYVRLEVHSLYVIKFLENIGLVPVKAAFKEIPQLILQSPKQVVAGFLQAYFEGDGSISSAPKMVELSAISTSEKLIKQLQILLLRFGIASAKRYDSYRSTHKLYLRGKKNYQLFEQEIGFVCQRKIAKLSQIVKKITKDSSLLDRIPYLRNYVLEHLDKTQSYTNREFAIKHNFDRYSNLSLNGGSVNKLIIPTLRLDIQQLFESLSQNNYLFDEITTIQDGGVQRVFSVKVDSNCHSFVANGFINHNTEARLSAIADELLRDINKETVDFIDNYSSSTQEPVLLPTVIPNLLLNGAAGIAVGMATQIPPHNLGEVSDALIYMIKNPAKKPEGEATEGAASATAFHSEATVEDLMQFIKGPDFPTGASIYDVAETQAAYATGKGRIVMRAKAEIEETRGGRFDIIITELPYQVNKAVLIAKIADLVKDKKIEGIADLRDESDRKGMRIVIELKRDAKPQSVLNNLYKHTALQSVFNVNMVALSDGVPHLMTLKRVLEEFISHRIIIIRRRSEFELKEAKHREHILEGLKIAVDNIDEVIRIIRASRDSEEAKNNLMKKFKLSEIQATAILDMQLRKLAALERQKIEDELKLVRELIAYLEDLLAHPEKILAVVKSETEKSKDRYSDARRTRVYKQKVGEFSEEDLVADESTIVTITQGGYVKRQLPATFRTQARGGKGVSSMTTKEEDAVSHIFYTRTLDNLLFFTDRGRVFQIKVWEIPESSRVAKGQAIVNLINVEQGERITAILTNRAKDKVKFLFMCTTNGNVKKTSIEEYANIRKNGLISIKLDAGDELKWVVATNGDEDVLLISRLGQSIRFTETLVRPTHRDTSGVRGIMLGKTDEVVSMNKITDPGAAVLVVMQNGLGKKTKLAAWKRQGRGGSGIKAAQVTDKTGPIVTAEIVGKDENLLVLTSNKGQLIKLNLHDVPTLQRQTQGVILMRMRDKEQIAAATVVSTREKEAVVE